MNSLGNIFRVSIYGESHGKGVGVLIDGVIPGINVKEEELKEELLRRKSGKIGTTSRIESDAPEVLSGIKDGYTTGAPINIFFKNENTDSKVYCDYKNHPRPGHADFVASKKYFGYNDLRGGGHFSGRLTLGIVTAGYFAKKILEKKELMSKNSFQSEIIKLGNTQFKELKEYELESIMKKLTEEGDSLGGIIQCRVKNVPIGFGEPFFDSVESLISHGVFSIPGIKGIEFGTGFRGCEMKGSQFNDAIINSQGKTQTNNSGGINGGITNGNDLVFNVAVKPTSSIKKTQCTFDFLEKEVKELKLEGRHDAAFVLRVPVILEAIAAIVLADLSLRRNK